MPLDREDGGEDPSVNIDSSSPAKAAAGVEAGEDDESDAFQPSSCNVAFGSAHDGWAFRLDQFAAMYAEKLGCRCGEARVLCWHM